MKADIQTEAEAAGAEAVRRRRMRRMRRKKRRTCKPKKSKPAHWGGRKKNKSKIGVLIWVDFGVSLTWPPI